MTAPGRKACTCGAHLDWSALPEIGRQAVPEDDAACDCGTMTRRFGNGGHASDCPSLGYTLIYKNCPHCKTTLCEEER